MSKQRARGQRYASLRKTTYGMNRRTDAAFTDEETIDFLNGVWVKCRSSNVEEMTYVEDDQTLFVTFKDHGKGEATYQYFGVSGTLAEAFASAPSKGGAVWDNLISQAVSYHRVG